MRFQVTFIIFSVEQAILFMKFVYLAMLLFVYNDFM